MDIATVIGFVASMGLIIWSMDNAASLGAFNDPVSYAIVFGGSIMVLLMRSKLADFINMWSKTIMKTIFAGVDKPADLIEQIIEMANIARKDGLIALEGQDIKNQFLSKGIGLLVDSTPPDIIDSSLENELSLMKSRHENAAMMYRSWADIAPAMGMIGTLIGLVQMLVDLSDPKAIGPAMAVALLTTLYGSLIANVIALPLCDKLTLRKANEGRLMAMCIDGVLGIQGGQNPRILESMLKTYVDPKKRAEDDET